MGSGTSSSINDDVAVTPSSPSNVDALATLDVVKTLAHEKIASKLQVENVAP